MRAIFNRWFVLVAVLGVLSCSMASERDGGDGQDTQGALNRSLLKEELARFSSMSEVPEISKAYYDFLRAEMALDNENFDEALKYYKEAAERDKAPSQTLQTRLAQLYIRAGKLEEALDSIDTALKQDATNLPLLQLRGGVLATLKNVPKAIETYEQVIHLAPDDEDPYIFLASLYAQEGQIDAAKKTLKDLLAKNPSSVFGYYYLARMSELSHDFEEAEKYYRKAIELSPGSDSLQIDYARLLGVQKRFPEAIRICDNLLKENPNNLAARRLRGQLLLSENKLDQALEAFEELGKLEEDPSETRFKIALIKIERRDLAGAETDLNLVLAKNPKNSQARYYLGTVYAGLNRMNEAIQELAKIEPDQKVYGQSKAFAAFLLQQQKRPEEAMKELDQALKESPEDVQLLTFMASLEREASQIGKAIDTMKQVITLDPKDDKHYFTIGVFYDEAKKKDDAIQSMRKAISINPKNANALNFLGYSLAESGNQLDEAEALVKQAIALEKENGYFIDSLGWIYYKMGRFRDAARELKHATELTPDDSLILEHYGQAELRLGNDKDALKTFKKALVHAPNSEDKEAEGRLKVLIEDLEKKLGPSDLAETHP